MGEKENAKIFSIFSITQIFTATVNLNVYSKIETKSLVST